MNEELWGWENRISQDISNQYIITNKKTTESHAPSAVHFTRRSISQLHMHRRRHRLPPLEGEGDGEVVCAGEGGKRKVDANTTTPKITFIIRK